MKKLASILLFFFICKCSFGRAWYFSISIGNDATGNGTITQPYKSIAKLNTIWASIVAGDQILFMGGEEFQGSIIVGKSGSSGNVITIGSYGTGEATITGMTPLVGWTNIGGNIWQSGVYQLKNNVNILTVDGTAKEIGRTPNSGTFFAYQTTTTVGQTGSLTSTSLPSSTNYTGAELVMRTNSFYSQRLKITAHAANTVQYGQSSTVISNSNRSSIQNGSNGYGCFIQRDPRTLDTNGEWYFDTTAKRMRFYSTVNPSTLTIKASYLDTLIVIGSRTFITVDNINIEGAGLYGIEAFNATNCTIQNSSFNNNTCAIYHWNGSLLNILNNTFENSFCEAILQSYSSNAPANRVNINNNYVHNTGKLFGNGTYSTSNNLKAILARVDTVSTAANYLNIKNNIVTSTGYMAIEFNGSNVIVRKNMTDSFCILIDDGGGIYTFVNNQSTNNVVYLNRLVDSNFVKDAIGAPAGAPAGHLDVAGIYMDDQALNVSMLHNTVYNIPGNGFQLNNPKNMSIIDNNVWNCDYPIFVGKKQFGELTGNIIKKNVLYMKTNLQYNFFTIVNNLQQPSAMTILQSLRRMSYIDSNWISNQRTSGFRFWYNTSTASPSFPAPTNLANWRADSIAHDIVSILPPTVLNNTNTNIYPNPTDSYVTSSFNGFNKVAPDGVTYNNSIVLAPYSSKVLIDNGASVPINKYPVVTATAGADSVLTLPDNTANLTGSATDTDGVITSYTWVQLSGPNTATGLPFTTASTPNVTVGGLIEGIYQFQLSATDNGGATSSKIVRVTVNAAIPNTPPTANAGVDKAITLPTSSTSVTGSGTNGSGTSISYSWMQISGPGTAMFGTPLAQSTTISNLTVDGTYTMKLTVTNNLGDTASDYMQIIVSPAPIVLPTANAGSDKAITLPTTSTSATASATLGSGSLVSYTWSFVTGPTTATFGTENALTTTINNLTTVGTYTVKFTVLNSQGNSASDNLDIVVSPAIPPVNQPPVSVPGANQTITLPTNTATVNGSGSTDPDGTITAYQWTITGPNVATSTTPNAVSTTFGNLIVGTYQARLRVTDNNSDTGSASLTITVLAAPNVLPTAVAGNDQTITLPTSSTSVDGSGSSDPDGITAYGWIQISGPSTATIASPSTAITGISNMVAGDYVFQLKVTGSNGSSDTAVDAIQITVNPAPVINPPIAYAGADSIVQLPNTTVHLLGGGTNGTGTIVSHVWTVFSGPTGSSFNDAAQYNVLVSGLVEGTYLFQLSVTDSNGLTSTDLVQVTVRPVIVQSIKVLLGYDIRAN